MAQRVSKIIHMTPPIPKNWKLYDGPKNWQFVPGAKFWSKDNKCWTRVVPGGAHAVPVMGSQLIVPERGIHLLLAKITALFLT